MNTNHPVYPEVKIVFDRINEGNGEVFRSIITTTLRKKDDEGKWRLCHYWFSYVFGPAEPSETEKQRAVQRFTREVYFFIINGRPNGLLNPDGSELYPLDTDQRDEWDRCVAEYPFLSEPQISQE